MSSIGTGDKVVSRGDILAGRYKVERILGEGGMGVVVAATHLELRQRVALKFMLPRAEESPDARERFLREARAAVRLKSQHVAKVLDMGTFEQSDGGKSPYIAMDFLEGHDLDQILDDNWPLAIDEAVEYVLHACEAVGEAHACGIVHRDLKPANLFLTKAADGAPCVKVLDFGISKLSSAAQIDRSITKTNSAMGTPHYMSPEQMRSAKTVDERSDIWSLGIILYELLTRRVPFDGESVTELIANVLETLPQPARELREEIPEELEAVVMRCLKKDRDERWDSVADFAKTLAPYGPERAKSYGDRVERVMEQAASSRDVAPSDDPPGATRSTVTNAVWRSGPSDAGNSNIMIFVAAGVMVAVAVVTGFFVGQAGKSDGDTESAEVAAPANAATDAPASSASVAVTTSTVAAKEPDSQAQGDELLQTRDELTAGGQRVAASVGQPSAKRPSAPSPQPVARPRLASPAKPAPAKSEKPAYCQTPEAFVTGTDGIRTRRLECR